MADHPWAHIPALIDAKVLTPQEANEDIIFAQRSAMRRAFRELNEVLVDMFGREQITAEGVARVQAVIVKAQADGVPDH